MAELDKFWTFERDSELQDYEFDTQEEAQYWADEAFAEQCQEESPANNEEFSEEITLVEFSFDDNGERVTHQEIESCVEYVHYHGDRKEHGYP